MKTCDTCKFWTRNTGTSHSNAHGGCSCPLFIYGSTYLPDAPPNCALVYQDCEGYSAYFETGEKFGCIHHEAI